MGEWLVVVVLGVPAIIGYMNIRIAQMEINEKLALLLELSVIQPTPPKESE